MRKVNSERLRRRMPGSLEEESRPYRRALVSRKTPQCETSILLCPPPVLLDLVRASWVFLASLSRCIRNESRVTRGHDQPLQIDHPSLQPPLVLRLVLASTECPGRVRRNKGPAAAASSRW